ncbi:MAG: hypothetical protein M3275_13635 [Thermoproteota archaeon]|nr:hypothetical protein [Thermoproteota archaeon]
MPLLMYDKFLVMITVVIALTFTIAGTTTTVVGQNQIINLTALLTPDTNDDTNDTNDTTTSTTLANVTAANNKSASTSATTTNLTATNNMTIEDAKELYLSVWNQTEFNATFSTFVEPFSAAGYGVYEERSNIFAPGETIVLYVEPVGFAHKQVIDQERGSNNNTMLYLMNMTSDYKIAAANGTELELQLIEDKQGLRNITSHRPNTEMYLTLTLTPEVQPLPIGSYVITYSVTDEISDESFELEKDITVAERE